MKRIIPIILLFVYSALLTIPYIPYMVFYTGKIIHHNEISIGVDNPETIIGDACYLNAIIERAKNDKASEKNETPPPPVMETSGLVYINSQSLFSVNKVPPVNFNFKGYFISINEIFLNVGVPPPNSISFT
jgi:hypothetical protein